MLRNLNTAFIIDDCLFGAVKLTKNADPDKQAYSGFVVMVLDLMCIKIFQ